MTYDVWHWAITFFDHSRQNFASSKELLFGIYTLSLKSWPLSVRDLFRYFAKYSFRMFDDVTVFTVLMPNFIIMKYFFFTIIIISISRDFVISCFRDFAKYSKPKKCNLKTG